MPAMNHKSLTAALGAGALALSLAFGGAAAFAANDGAPGVAGHSVDKPMGPIKPKPLKPKGLPTPPKGKYNGPKLGTPKTKPLKPKGLPTPPKGKYNGPKLGTPKTKPIKPGKPSGPDFGSLKWW
ncbi:MAG: hypothetical protein QM728_14975 [Gordonia sp. (in: high G+C Gram-positive bacteria)]|uniref:hypothetical protein n=1 Tax=Gordonia sp. (in: high G+C Gram-positive bacteria) TaxID=84139 RepID=UPI0039E22B8C